MNAAFSDPYVESPRDPAEAARRVRLMSRTAGTATPANRLIPAETDQANGLPQDPLKQAQEQSSLILETTNSPFARPHPYGRSLPGGIALLLSSRR
jgi:hypothetical protein